jgi:hypothetical protein
MTEQVASKWLSWFAAPVPGAHDWRVCRFERVTEEGTPIGKALVSLSPANQMRTFKTEAAANRAAQWLNFEEGR